jgi:hypothetical protein
MRLKIKHDIRVTSTVLLNAAKEVDTSSYLCVADELTGGLKLIFSRNQDYFGNNRTTNALKLLNFY